MNSVERIRHYTLNVPAESDTMSSPDNNGGANRSLSEVADSVAIWASTSVQSTELIGILPRASDSDVVTPPPEWPNKGAIQVSDLRMRYRNGPDILKGVSFDVAGGSKVGIVGRTGSGKSSLMVALFRIENYRPYCAITIDGIDIR